MGLTIRQSDYDKDSRALKRAVLAWTRKNFVWLHRHNPRVAEACLVDGMTFDVANRRLVRTSPADGLRRQPSHIYLEPDPTPPNPKTKNNNRASILRPRRSPPASPGGPYRARTYRPRP